MTIKAITAFGTRGLEDVLFIAKPDRTGRYVLNKKQPSNAKHPTNKAVNKVYASTLDEAATLLRTDDYLINLIGPDGKRALRELRKVRFVPA